MNSADPAALVKQAKSFLKSKQHEDAVPLLQQALSINPDNADAHELVATAYFLAGDDTQAADHFDRVTKLKPTSGGAFVNLGAVCNRMGDYKRAVEALRKGIQKDNKSALGFYNLGIAQKQLNQMKMAVSAYREAVRLDPDMVDAHLNLANTLRDMGNKRSAKEHYKKALALKPGFAAAERGLAKLEEADKESATAASPFGRLVDESKAQRGAATLTGRQLTDEERFEDRQLLFRHATSIEPALSEFVSFLKGNLEKQVSSMHRAVIEDLGGAQTGGYKAMSQAHDDFRACINRIKQLRRQLKRRVLELRGHEEVINTPELPQRPT